MVQFSAREQYFLELLNRARMNPNGEAARYGISLNADLPAGTISAASKQVLAPNSFLNDAARAHSSHMFEVDLFAHSGIGDSDPGARITAAGYNWFMYGENIAWTSVNSVDQHHKNLFLSAGHRENILAGDFREVGIGTSNGSFFYSGSNWANSLMTTQNFGTSTSGVFVTGVSYNDTLTDDNFYTVGEAASGRTVTLYKDGSAIGSGSVWSSGGYAVKTSASGSVEAVFSGSGLANSKGAKVNLGNSNIKLDIVDGTTIESNVTVELTRGSQDARLLGVNSVSVTGNALNNVLIGNCVSNTLSGKDGNDSLHGQNGNDVLRGGDGNDTLTGGVGADTLSGDAGANKYRYFAASHGGDSILTFNASDSFVFEGSAFGFGSYSGALSASAFKTGTNNSAADTSDRFIFNTSTDTLWFDSNGSAAGGTHVMIADLAVNVNVTAADILIC